jgi:hypothetical protein
MGSLQALRFYRQPVPLQRTLYRCVLRRSYLRERELRRGELRGYSLKDFDTHRCMFIHIPKTAGSSISMSLFGSLGGGHRTAGRYRLIFGQQRFDEYFKFAFVRNPWDRVLSAYNYLKAGGSSVRDREFSRQHLTDFDSFGDFVRRWLRVEDVHSQVHFMPQHEFIGLDDQDIAVDFLGRYETLETDFAAVSTHLGLSPSLGTETRVTNRRGSYRDEYDEETRGIVSDVYARDIEMFGYEF